MLNKITVLIADDHALIRAGIRALLEREQDIAIVGEAVDGREAVSLSRELRPNIVLMDIGMPELNGLEATRQIVEELPGVRVLALTVYSDAEHVSLMLRAGASGYLIKGGAWSDLSPAIRLVNGGTTFLSPEIASTLPDERGVGSSSEALTPRQREILQLLAEGNTSREIAQKLCISIKTVEVHRAQLSNKLRLHSVADLVRYAIREGLTSL